MATILLSRHSETEPGQSSLSTAFTYTERILDGKHSIIPIPSRPWTDKSFEEWIVEHAFSANVCLTNAPRLIRLLRENGWSGKIIIHALGSFPRGAVTVRATLPYLYKTDVIWCSSTADQMIFQNLVECDGSQPETVLLPYAVESETFVPLDQATKEHLRRAWNFDLDDFVLVYAGRVTIEKNVHSTLEVLHELNRRGMKVKLVIAGRIEDVPFREFNMFPAGLRDKLNAKIEFFGLSDLVTIEPWLESKQLNELYNVADALINLTLHHDENFGLTQIEAMSAGLPVVATAWGGLKDTLIEGKTGFLADTWTSEYGIRFDWPKVIDAVTTLIESPELRKEMSHFARQHVLEHFALTVYSQNLLQLIDYVLEGSSEKSCAHYTDFGQHFSSRFGRDSRFSKDPVAMAPVYTDFSDRDYRHLIKPYVSRDQIDLTPDSNLFGSLPGRLEGDFFLSSDLLWPVRIRVDHRESETLRQLNRWQPVSRRNIQCSDDVIDALLRKGLAGVSSLG